MLKCEGNQNDITTQILHRNWGITKKAKLIGSWMQIDQIFKIWSKFECYPGSSEILSIPDHIHTAGKILSIDIHFTKKGQFCDNFRKTLAPIRWSPWYLLKTLYSCTIKTPLSPCFLCLLSKDLQQLFSFMASWPSSRIIQMFQTIKIM